MYLHPESRGNRGPRIAMAAAALFSVSLKYNEHIEPTKSSSHSNTINEASYKPKKNLNLSEGFLLKIPSLGLNIDKPNQTKAKSRPIVVEVAPTTTTTTTTVPQTPAEIAASEVAPLEYDEWSKVNYCEEHGNWYVEGPNYYGGLGISAKNWIAYGGEYFAPNGALATPDEQIIIAEKIQFSPPDQDGCDGSW